MLFAALSLALLAAPAPVSAGQTGLATARKLVDDFQFSKALAVIADTLREGGLDTATLIALYELEGIAHATNNAPAAAKESFARLLTLDPAHALPAELPPKARTLYFGARALAQREPLELAAEAPARTDGFIALLAVNVKASSLLPATAVRFTVSIDGGAAQSTVVPLEAGRKPTLAVHGARVTWSAALLGARASVLRTVERDEQPPAPEPVKAAPVAAAVLAPVERPATWVRPAGIAVGAVGLAGVGVGVVFGLRANGDRAKVLNASTNGSGVVTGLTQAEAARLDASARSNALLANVLMISGGALAATGLLMAVLAPSSPSAPVNAVQLSIGPASLVASGQF